MKWFSERMTAVEIEVPDRYARRVTEVLANDGLLQLEDISYLNTSKEHGYAQDCQTKAIQFANLEKQLSETMQTLKINLEEAPDKQFKMLSDPEQLQPFANQLSQEVQESSQVISETQKKIAHLRHNIDLLEPLSDVDIPFDRIRNRRYIFSILGTMPSSNIDRFKTSMAKVPFVLLVLKQTTELAIVLLIGLRQNKDYLQRTARSAYLSGIDLSDTYQGTPAQIIASIKAEIDVLEEQVGNANQEVDRIRENRSVRLQDLYWHVRYSRLMCEALMRYGRLKQGYLIAGWLPSNQLEVLTNDLTAISPEILIDIKQPGEERDLSKTPIVMERAGFQQGFQKLVTTYGMPEYNELNPTLLMMLTFPVIFGAMFGDVGHGLILAIAGLMLMLNKIKKLKKFSSLGSVIFLCGIVAMVFGVLFGSIFGMEDLIPAVWDHPMENIMSLLLITGAGGALLLTVANIMGLVNDFHQRHWIHFFMNSRGLAGLLLYWSLIGIVLSLFIRDFPINKIAFVVTTVLSIIMIFLSGFLERLIEKKKPYMEGGPFVYLIQSFFELFETVIGYLSNSLSYVRIGAFAVAHAGLSSVFFILANLISPTKGFGYWLVVIFGNIFVIGFEGMIVSIQTLRLEYYEFFSKFFSGRGRKYLPFRISKSNSEGVK